VAPLHGAGVVPAAFVLHQSRTARITLHHCDNVTAAAAAAAENSGERRMVLIW